MKHVSVGGAPEDGFGGGVECLNGGSIDCSFCSDFGSGSL